ncbi:MAG: hypothetical protein KAR83_03915 [Thermodesulfovibrionales bacterium]|nr:hypothetical protein [Thermodesulfovibrionales bacterium]
MKKVLVLFFAIWLSGCALQMTEHVKEFECPPASSCTYTVSCEAGESLTGGGFKLNHPGIGVLDIWASHPEIGKNAWRVSTMNKQDETMLFSIYAMCGEVK